MMSPVAMSTVLAAIDNTAAARPVLAAARAMASLLHSDVEALHVREDGDLTAQAAARAAGVALREVDDPAVDSLIREAASENVVALVLGARGVPAGRHPAGHVALHVITSLAKPLVIVPPQALPVEVTRVLVPLDGTTATAAALRKAIDLACRSAVDVVVLHVHPEESLPLFEDQPQHEHPAWEAEFLARYCPSLPHGSRLEVRVGEPGEHVLDVAAEVGADLVALGWSRDLSRGRAAVVREVLARSPIPVLLVPVAARPAA
jgi:nucleotide-binding universal stress UspA family protein